MNEKGYFKICHREKFRLGQMHVWRPGRTRWKSLDFIFRSQMHQKRLAAGIRPDPLEEIEHSPVTLTAVGAMEGDTF